MGTVPRHPWHRIGRAIFVLSVASAAFGFSPQSEPLDESLQPDFSVSVRSGNPGIPLHFSATAYAATDDDANDDDAQPALVYSSAASGDLQFAAWVFDSSANSRVTSTPSSRTRGPPALL